MNKPKKKLGDKIVIKKWTSRKFILMTALFIMAQIFKWNGKIGDTAWIIASGIGTFGLIVVLAFLQYKKVYDKPEGK
jgi:hypothetical protein